MRILWFTTIVLLLFSLTMGCSGDNNSPELKSDSFRVKAISITASKFPTTEGDALELYGEISASITFDGIIAEEHIFWERNRDFYESVGTQEYFINSEGSEHVFTLTEEEQQNDARIGFYVQMSDRDPVGNSDDILGVSSTSQFVIILKDLLSDENPGELEFWLREFSGVEVWVRMSIEHLR